MADLKHVPLPHNAEFHLCQTVRAYVAWATFIPAFKVTKGSLTVTGLHGLLLLVIHMDLLHTVSHIKCQFRRKFSYFYNAPYRWCNLKSRTRLISELYSELWHLNSIRCWKCSKMCTPTIVSSQYNTATWQTEGTTNIPYRISVSLCWRAKLVWPLASSGFRSTRGTRTYLG